MLTLHKGLFVDWFFHLIVIPLRALNNVMESPLKFQFIQFATFRREQQILFDHFKNRSKGFDVKLIMHLICSIKSALQSCIMNFICRRESHEFYILFFGIADDFLIVTQMNFCDLMHDAMLDVDLWFHCHQSIFHYGNSFKLVSFLINLRSSIALMFKGILVTKFMLRFWRLSGLIASPTGINIYLCANAQGELVKRSPESDFSSQKGKPFRDYQPA